MSYISPLPPQNFVQQPAGAQSRKLRYQIVGAALSFLLLGGAYGYYQSGGQSAAIAAPAASPVSVQTLLPRTVEPFSQFSGRVNAVDYAEIRPQVSGRITEIRFRDGQLVKAGDILFVIDPRPYQAAVAKAEGDLAGTVSSSKLSKVERERGERLVKTQTLSQEQFDQRAMADDSAQAKVKSAEAALAAARLNVDYAFVKAPISGRISRAEITLGNLVGTGVTPPLLASIVSDNGVYADFEVDEQTYLNNVRGHARTQDQQQAIPVDLTVQGDTGAEAHVYRGTVESFDNRIDTGSGTIRARARFANEDGALMPGMFVSVRMGGGAIDNALLVPAGAIGNDQSKRFVFVVGEGDKAEYRPVKLGTEIDGNRVVISGLKSGDRVILDGLQKLSPGAHVAPQSAGRQTASN